VGDGLRLALTTFTAVPVRGGRTGQVDRRAAGRAIALGPLLGAVLGLAAAGVLLVARMLYQERLGLPLVGALAITSLALLTRGRHLDGLADTADGLASDAPRNRALQIMVEPGAGAVGVAALILNVLLQVGALTVCVLGHRGTQSLLLAVLTGRLAVVLACTPRTPAARPDGLGALVAGTVRPVVALALTAVVAVEAAAYGRLDSDAGSLTGSLRAVGALAVGLGVAALLRRHAVRRFGGITGDVLGALVEVATTVVLLAMAALN